MCESAYALELVHGRGGGRLTTIPWCTGSWALVSSRHQNTGHGNWKRTFSLNCLAGVELGLVWALGIGRCYCFFLLYACRSLWKHGLTCSVVVLLLRSIPVRTLLVLLVVHAARQTGGLWKTSHVFLPLVAPRVTALGVPEKYFVIFSAGGAVCGAAGRIPLITFLFFCHCCFRPSPEEYVNIGFSRCGDFSKNTIHFVRPSLAGSLGVA